MARKIGIGSVILGLGALGFLGIMSDFTRQNTVKKYEQNKIHCERREFGSENEKYRHYIFRQKGIEDYFEWYDRQPFGLGPEDEHQYVNPAIDNAQSSLRKLYETKNRWDGWAEKLENRN